MAPMGFRIITSSKVVITSLKVVNEFKSCYYNFVIKIFFLLMAPIELRTLEHKRGVVKTLCTKWTQ